MLGMKRALPVTGYVRNMVWLIKALDMGLVMNFA